MTTDVDKNIDALRAVCIRRWSEMYGGSEQVVAEILDEEGVTAAENGVLDALKQAAASLAVISNNDPGVHEAVRRFARQEFDRCRAAIAKATHA